MERSLITHKRTKDKVERQRKPRAVPGEGPEIGCKEKTAKIALM